MPNGIHYFGAPEIQAVADSRPEAFPWTTERDPENVAKVADALGYDSDAVFLEAMSFAHADDDETNKTANDYRLEATAFSAAFELGFRCGMRSSREPL